MSDVGRNVRSPNSWVHRQENQGGRPKWGMTVQIRKGSEMNKRACRWMQELPDDLLLVDTFIPASHDSGTYSLGIKGAVTGAATQAGNFFQQLEVGIRYFDVRCTKSSHTIVLKHSFINGEPFKNVVCEQILPFLETYDQEIVFLDIDISDNCESGVLRIVDEYIDHEKIAVEHLRSQNGDRVLNNKVSWGDLREKGRRLIITWSSKETKYNNSHPWLTCNENIRISPYSHFNDRNIDSILDFLDESVRKWDKKKLFIAQVIDTPFFSPVDKPILHEKSAHEKLNGWVIKHTRESNMNIVMRDFVNLYPATVRRIFNMNFIQYSPYYVIQFKTADNSNSGTDSSTNIQFLDNNHNTMGEAWEFTNRLHILYGDALERGSTQLGVYVLDNFKTKDERVPLPSQIKLIAEGSDMWGCDEIIVKPVERDQFPVPNDLESLGQVLATSGSLGKGGKYRFNEKLSTGDSGDGASEHLVAHSEPYFSGLYAIEVTTSTESDSGTNDRIELRMMDEDGNDIGGMFPLGGRFRRTYGDDSAFPTGSVRVGLFEVELSEQQFKNYPIPASICLQTDGDNEWNCIKVRIAQVPLDGDLPRNFLKDVQVTEKFGELAHRSIVFHVNKKLSTGDDDSRAVTVRAS